jgi:hypothetical protein
VPVAAHPPYSLPMAEHRVALGTYDEPGLTRANGECQCGWMGPLRVASAQAAVDAGWHLMDPGLVVFGDDWHAVVGDERRRLYERFTPAWGVI